MKKVLAKDLKVGDIVNDGISKNNKFVVKKIYMGTLYMFSESNYSLYLIDSDGFYHFDIDNNPWYMED